MLAHSQTSCFRNEYLTKHMIIHVQHLSDPGLACTTTNNKLHNLFVKATSGENYSHHSFILIPKQKGRNCDHFPKHGISRINDHSFLT